MALLNKRRKRKFCTFVLSNYLLVRNLLISKAHASGEGHLIVSLTTHPPRVRDVHLTIESLMAQRTNNFEIHLYISRKDMNVIGRLPATLQRQIKRGLRVIVTDEDYRSYDKLVHALGAHPNATIVTADDDVIYPPNWLARLLEGAQQYPDCIICHRGHLLSESSPGSKRICYYASRANQSQSVLEPSFRLMPTGNGGVLYPPGSLDPIALDNTAFQELAPSADDIWFKIASLKRGTRCFRINMHNIDFFPTRSARQQPLHKENIGQNGNDRQFSDCLDRYPEVKEYLFPSLPAHPSDVLTTPTSSPTGKPL